MRIVLAIVAVLTAFDVTAQAYPAKPIRTVLTVSGGGETPARAVADKISQSLAVPIIIEGQSGAGGAVGATTVARAPADGYTVLYATVSSMVLRKYVVKDMPYDTLRDFTPVAQLGGAVAGVVVSNAVPVNTFAELLDYARLNPNKLSYATTGIGTTHHLSGVLIEQLTGAKMVHVPYKSGPQSVTDLVGGNVHVAIGVLGTYMPLVQAGKMKLVAINGPQRYRAMPNVPTTVESIKGYNALTGWIGYFVPAGVPQPIVQRLEGETIKALGDATVRARIEASDTLVDPASGEHLAHVIKGNFELAEKLVKAAGIVPE
jgi:tripartite-type tricarboxylate transporter receptor subunit TctC